MANTKKETASKAVTATKKDETAPVKATAEVKKEAPKAETKKTTKKATKAVAKKEEKVEAKAVKEVKAEAKAEKKPAKATKKTTAKTPTKKTTTKKTPSKKAVKAPKVNVFVEFNGVQVSLEEVMNNIKIVNGKDASEYTVYLKPQENKAYFVADNEEKEMDVFFC